MAEISEVPGISGSTLELFRKAGFETAESLAQRSVAEILAQLEAANRGHAVPVRLPAEASVRVWQNAAASLLRRSGQIDVLPAATAVDGAALEAAGIDVHAMPVANVVPKADDSRRPRAEQEAGEPDGSALPVASKPAGAASGGARGEPRRDNRSPSPEPMPTTETRGTSAESPDRGVVRRRIEGAARPVAAEETDQPRGSRFRTMETVQQTAPPSERRNRGMSHPDAGRVRFAAAVTVLCVLLSTVAALALASALIRATFFGGHFEWTTALLLLVFPVCLFLYLTIGTRVRCRLCGQRLFVPKHCHKHERARRSIFGHTFAVARDAAIFGGYRCMLCGTKTRLRD